MSIDPSYTKSSCRDWKQVLCNGGIGSLLSLIYQYMFDGRQMDQLTVGERKLMVLLIWAYIGFYACCAADTWASELGALSSDWPVLITTLKPVPPGTNGGISKLGLLASFAGGAAIGLAADICLWIQYFSAYRSGVLPKIPYNMLGSLLGMLGSLTDSLLGATMQASYLINKRVVSDVDARELKKADDAKLVCGNDILSNNMVNFVASALTVTLAVCFFAIIF
ncbi:hypothetical protein LPJ72_001170 [Coemansia sp. Benny D160-2]|nr:hypothetical protein LPJ72_001170 [Coemansia sp. Benny D160-2]